MLEKLKIDNKIPRQVFAMLLALIMLLAHFAWSGVGIVSADPLTSVSDTLSTSAPSTVADHTIQFVTPTGVLNASETITITFDAGFTGVSAIDNTDVDIAFDTDDDACDGMTEISLAAAADATNWGVAASGQVVTLTHSTDGADQDIPAGRCVQVEIGTNATNPVTGDAQITNPSKTAAAGTADISTIDIAGTFGDTGSALVATVEGTDVSVTVDATLSFTVAGVLNTSCTADTSIITDTIDTSGDPTSVPFGTVNLGEFYTACQLLSVETNASNGYSLTAQEDTSLKFGTNLIDDTACDSACTPTSGTAWDNDTNYGLGYFCETVTGSACDAAGSGESNYRRFACTGDDTVCSPDDSQPPVTVMADPAPTSGDDARINFKISVNPAQAAGTYENIVTYTATPVF